MKDDGDDVSMPVSKSRGEAGLAALVEGGALLQLLGMEQPPVGGKRCNSGRVVVVRRPNGVVAFQLPCR